MNESAHTDGKHGAADVLDSGHVDVIVFLPRPPQAMYSREVEHRVNTTEWLHERLGFTHIAAVDGDVFLLELRRIFRRERKHPYAMPSGT